jgi:hypothetical protein
MDVTDIAQSFEKTGNALGLDRSDFHRELTKLAAESRRPTESIEQSYARLAVESEAGKALFKGAVFGPAPVEAAQDLVKPMPQSAGKASSELEALARDMARRKNMSYERAYSELYTDPERAELVARVRREERDATARVRAQRFPLPAYQGEGGSTF